MYTYNLENRVERDQSSIVIENAYQIKINYRQSHVFNKGDNPFTFLFVYASDIKQDGCYAGNHVAKVRIIEIIITNLQPPLILLLEPRTRN